MPMTVIGDFWVHLLISGPRYPRKNKNLQQIFLPS